ncbi:MAG: hypothetical protein FD152_1372 [Xanthobacteraceae bacterium]|nr:MAG: hypothetical protein FD152_1372 [Xanthobacteraceae bacterium]
MRTLIVSSDVTSKPENFISAVIASRPKWSKVSAA